MYVSSGIIDENAYSEQLRRDYQGAFEEWALEVGRLQAIMGPDSSSDSGDLHQARQRAAAAEIAYRASRDRLTENMGWMPPNSADLE
jgi:hypothetical protein